MKVRWKRFAARRRKLLITLGVIMVVLVAARIYLPFGLQRYVNHKLDEIPEYDGRVGDIDVHLWRGAYEIEDVQLVKTTGKIDVPVLRRGPRRPFGAMGRPVRGRVRGPDLAQ